MFRVAPVLLSLLFALSALAQVADITVSITAAPELVHPGDQVTFTADVANLGPDPAESTHITMWQGPWVCYEQFMIGTLQPGEKRSFTCTGPTPSSPPYYGFWAEVSVSSATRDSNYENNGDERPIRLITPPDLFIFTNHQGVIPPALPFTMTLRYGNRAAVAATGGVITITSPTPITKAPDYCTITGTRAVCAVGNVTSYVDFDVEIVAPDTSNVPVPVVFEIAANEAENAPEDNRFTTTSLTTFTTFFVTTANDSGSGSLRAAIEEANATCTDQQRPCLIAFRIPAAGEAPHTIAPQSPLPVITAANIQVDGGTQRRFFGNTVELRGNALAAGDGLEAASSCTVFIRELVIDGFPGNGINVRSSAGCDNPFRYLRLEKNVLRGNGRGIAIHRSSVSVADNVIRDSARAGLFIASGQTSVTTNTIEHNGASGIFVSAQASGSDIRNNTLAHNAHFGVGIAREATNVSVNENLIFANNEMPIDYGLDGLSTVEPVPPPEITSVRFENGETFIEATSTAIGTFSPIVELYANDYPHPRGFGEGQQYLGRAESAYPAPGWRLRVPRDLRGKWLAATATRVIYTGWARTPRTESATQDFFTTTSEFSRAIEVR